MNLAEKLPEEITNFPAEAMAVKVVDQTTLNRAVEVVKALKDFKKQTSDWFSPIKKKAHDSWKEIVAKENEALAPLDAAEKHVRDEMNRYANEQERIRLETERKARLLAEEEARKERARLEAQAEKAIEKGKDAKAESLLEQSENVYVAPVAVASTVAPVKTESASMSYQDNLVVEVVDIKAFVAALVAHGSAMTMLEVKPAPLTAWVKANAIEKFTGLRIEKTKVAVVR